MILIDAGERNDHTFDSVLVFASQLAAQGYSVGIDERTLPDTLDRHQKYEVAPYLVDVTGIAVTRFLLIGAETISEQTLRMLRSYDFTSVTPVSAIGRFTDHQALVSAQSKIAYVLGREPDVVDLRKLQKKPLLPSAISPLVAGKAAGVRPADHTPPQLFVFLPTEMLEDTQSLSLLGSLDNVRGYRLNLVLAGKGKEQIKDSRFAHLSAFAATEFSPSTFAKMADIAVFFGEDVPGERMAAFALEMLQADKVVIDCTRSEAFVACGAPVLRGPDELGSLANYLVDTVITNVEEISHFVANSRWLDGYRLAGLEHALGLAPQREPLAQAAPARTIFLPTNGVGLGHAQRCALIASAMPRPGDYVFAAFPSCFPLIEGKGFSCLPLVQKSPYHPEVYANDLINYLRLQRAVRTGDRLIFDGGYVFDSIYRVVFEKQLSAIWIRRGLWQASQSNAVTLDREKAFEKVIVPNEAFDELNSEHGYGHKIYHIGPVVQESATDADDGLKLRDRLKAHLGHPFDQLAVTMLGSGVAADRSAQMQTLTNIYERRKNCLHLILIWPGAIVPTGVFGWKNTRVVQTMNALELCKAADLVVTAVGYNSFHEILYHQIPAILVPQMAAFMDDQDRRARAASERGLAETVLATEMLLLEREVMAFLDSGKAGRIRANLAAHVLPPRGNHLAATLIDGGGRA